MSVSSLEELDASLRRLAAGYEAWETSVYCSFWRVEGPLAGPIGTVSVVAIWLGEPGCILEVFDALGESIAVVAVPESFVEPLSADEVLSARRHGRGD